MTKQSITSLLLPFAILMASPLILRAAGSADSEQVSKLLSQAKTDAYQIKEDASAMESYTRLNQDWRSHATTVNEMKEHINAVGRIVAKLDESRSQATPWQATAIDRIKPLLREIASNTQSIILTLNKDPRRLTQAEYKDYIEANADEATQLSELIADFVNYGNSKSRMERLGTKLELPTT